MVICKRCRIAKPESCFKPGSLRNNTMTCLDCVKEKDYLRKKDWNDLHPDRHQKYNEKYPEYERSAALRKFGLTIADYDALAKEQNGVCAICGGVNRDRSLAVDHDHDNGIIRGLLCGRCNMAIGLMSDNADILRKAALYIESKSVALEGR